MEKTQLTPKGEAENIELPTLEPNGLERTPISSEEDRSHSSEPERVLEWGGPNNRYGKVIYLVGS